MAQLRYGVYVTVVAGTIFGVCIGKLLSTLSCNILIPYASSCSRCQCCNRFQPNVDIDVQKDVVSGHQGEHKANRIFIKEADEKGFLFVGVMTAKKYLDSRVVAAYNTWARSIHGKVVFFSSENSQSNFNVPVVSLKNVDDAYPPLKKAFSMLKYMFDHYIDKYEWFMRADDDIFVKGDKLEKFLRSINSSRPQFIGLAGTGKKEDIGLLGLGSTENFCMGGPGMIFSHATLRKVAPHLKYCLNNAYVSHDDVETGRCVTHILDIPCTWALEAEELFYHNKKECNGSFVNALHDKVVQKAITMHPVKMPTHQYRVYNHFTATKITDLRQKEIDLQREINMMNQVLNERNSSLSNKYGEKPSVTLFTPHKGSEMIGWEFLSNNKKLSSHLNFNLHTALTTSRKQALAEVVNQAIDIINSRQRERTMYLKDISYGYLQTNPYAGAGYILDILLKYRKDKNQNPNIRRLVYLHQTFTQIEFTESPLTLKAGNHNAVAAPPLFRYLRNGSVNSTSTNKLTETVHFILPLAGKVKEFGRFMKIFEDICLVPQENAQLHIVLFTENSTAHDVEDILYIVSRYQKKYGNNLLKVIEGDGHFARAKALDLGVKQCAPGDLLFCVDVDIILTRESLMRIRLNTIEGTQVYYPIVFSQYDLDVTCRNQTQCRRDFRPTMGNWRHFGYGMVAMYRSDLDGVGGLDTSIQGWGYEDVDLFQKCVESNLTVFRAIDTGMIHAFHPVICDSGLTPAQYKMCVGSRATCQGSQRHLAEMVMQMHDVLHRNEETAPQRARTDKQMKAVLRSFSKHKKNHTVPGMKKMKSLQRELTQLMWLIKWA